MCKKHSVHRNLKDEIRAGRPIVQLIEARLEEDGQRSNTERRGGRSRRRENGSSVTPRRLMDSTMDQVGLAVGGSGIGVKVRRTGRYGVQSYHRSCWECAKHNTEWWDTSSVGNRRV